MSPVATVCHRHGALVPAGDRCPLCARADTARRGARRVAHGRSTKRWERRRAAKLRRDPVCELGLPGCLVDATSVHVPAEFEGDHLGCPDDALVSACASCHGAIDAPRARRR